MIIDGHVHVFPAHSPRYPRTTDKLAPADREAPVELLLRTMDASAVDGAVLVPLGPEDDYVRECVQRYPRRFVSIGVAGQGCVGAVSGVDGIKALAHRVSETGIRGLRMSWLGDPDRPMTDSPAYPSLRWMAEHGLVLWFYAPPAQLRLLTAVVAELPDLNVVLNHLGFCPERIDADAHRRPRITISLPPPTLATVLDLSSSPSARIMLSGQYAFSGRDYPYPDLNPIVRRLHSAFGAERLMWASDFPWPLDLPGYDRLLELPERQLPGLTAGEREALFAGTAVKLFPGAWNG